MFDASTAANLVDPAILFFFFGLLAVSIRSNLEIPTQIAKALSLYLLMAIGLKGGLSLAASGVTWTMLLALGAAIVMALAIPAWSWLLLKRRIDPFDAAAIAATYGSVSAVTFIAASSFLDTVGEPYGGYMTVALVIMESPAVIMAILLANLARREAARTSTVPSGAKAIGAAVTPQPAVAPVSLREVLLEAFTDGALVLLLGSMAIGLLAGSLGAAEAPLAGFVGGDLFKGLLAFFLLDMGIQVGHRLREKSGELNKGLIVFALVMPPVNATAAGVLAAVLGLPLGDAVLLVVLSASASYIVVPAVVRYAIPEANPGVYFTMSLAFTFPFNLVVGIPLYHAVLAWFWAG